MAHVALISLSILTHEHTGRNSLFTAQQATDRQAQNSGCQRSNHSPDRRLSTGLACRARQAQEFTALPEALTRLSLTIVGPGLRYGVWRQVFLPQVLPLRELVLKVLPSRFSQGCDMLVCLHAVHEERPGSLG